MCPGSTQLRIVNVYLKQGYNERATNTLAHQPEELQPDDDSNDDRGNAVESPSSFSAFAADGGRVLWLFIFPDRRRQQTGADFLQVGYYMHESWSSYDLLQWTFTGSSVPLGLSRLASHCTCWYFLVCMSE